MKLPDFSRLFVIAVLFAMMTIGMASAEVVYSTDFSTDPATDGWTGFTAGQWEWGEATASTGCYYVQDPADDHSPSADDLIVGYAIGACYTNSIPETYLDSPAFDCSGYDNVFINFWRWIGVESATYDHASIDVSIDGSSWTTVWDHTETNPYYDEEWTNVEYDITSIAANQSTVYVRFVMGATDTSVVYCGWNIDDFQLIAANNGTLAGTVTDDTDAPIEGAVVTVVETGMSATTIADGSYTLAHLSGTYEVTCEAVGHNTASASGVVIEGSMTTNQDFTMTYPIIGVNPTEVNVTMNINSTQTEVVTISNTGNGPLDFGLQLSYPSTDDMWDVLFSHDVETLSGDTLCLGSEFMNGSIWVTGAASNSAAAPNYLYEISADGTTLLNTYNQASSAASDWGYRDLAHDGTYLYAGCASNFYQIDPTDGSVVTEVSHTLGVVIRALAYDPDAGTFYTGDFANNIYEFSFDGSSITAIRNFNLGLPAKYGMAWDNYSEGGPFLWVNDQGDGITGVTNIVQVDPSTPSLTGVSHLYSGTDSAGGLFCTTEWDTSKIVIGGLVQGTPDTVFGLELGSWSTWVSLDPTSGSVPAGGSVDVDVMFDSAVENPGTYNAIMNINHNSGDETVFEVPLSMTVNADYWVAIDPTYQEGLAEAGFSETYTVAVQNIGSANDTYNLSVVSSVWNMTFPGGSSVAVAAGASENITVQIDVPGGTAVGATDLGTFAVTSQNAPAMIVEGQVETECSVSVGYIDGTVTSDMGANPVAGATVTVAGLGLTGTTAADGTYFIDMVPLGTYTVTCDAPGYIMGSENDVEVTFHATTTVDFDLLYGEIDITPASFDVMVPIGGTLNETMTIANLGTGNLDYAIAITPPGLDEVGTWTNVTPIGASPTQWPGGCFGGGDFFVIGGLADSSSTIYNAIMIYDTAAGTWSESATLSTPVFCTLAEYYMGKVYVIGGYADGSFNATNAVQIYDVAANTWSAGANMPTARGGNCGGIIDGKIYSLGGSSDSSFPAENVAYEYDIATNTWTTLANGPISTYGISLGGGCAYNGKIYAGGHFSSAYTQFYEFDPAGGGVWTTKAGMPAAFGNLTPSLMGLETEGYILATGAGADWTATGTTYMYDPTADTWTNLNKPMTSAVLGGACAAGYGEIYFYGGTQGSGPVTPAPFMMNTFNYISWVGVSPDAGTVAASGSANVTVSFDADAAGGVGTYDAWLVVTSNDGDENPVNVPVSMTVYDGPTPTQGPTEPPTATPTMGTPEDYLMIEDFSGCNDDSIVVPVMMSNDNVAVDAVTFHVMYDSNMLTYVSCEAGNLDPGWTMFDCLENTAGDITIAGFALPPAEIPAGSDGVLVNLTFTVECPGCSEGDMSSVELTDLRDDIASFSVMDGRFTYSCETPTNTPTPTSVPPTSTPTPTSVPATNTPTPTSVPATATPTNTPTSEPPTATPTEVPPTATPTVEVPTATPTEAPCDYLGTELEMSQDEAYRAGDNFWVKCHVCNNTGAAMTNVPTAVLLGVYGQFWFYPTWTEAFEVEYRDYDVNLTTFNVFDEFTWPTVDGEALGLEFYSALLTDDMSNIIGDYDYVTFGYTDK